MKKQFIQKLSIAMAAALTVTSVAQAPVSAATKAMKMDRDSKILYLNEDNSSKTGKSYDFSIKNKGKNYKKLYTFSWYADDDAIVSVKKGGVVTAKKVGKTKVYCTIKNKKGKTVANPKATVEVKANAATVDITNLPENNIMEPGQTIDFNRTMKNFKGGKATDKTEWIVSANEEGTEATEVATVIDSQGNVTANKAGEFYLTARCYQSKKYKERTTTSKTIKITVKAALKTAENSAYNEVKLTFNDDMSKTLTEKNIVITNASGINQVVKGVSFEEGGKVAKVTVYNALTNDAVYTVKAGELDAVDFTAKVGEVASIEITSPSKVAVGVATDLKYVLKDANGVVLAGNDDKVTYEYDFATSSCNINGQQITCYEVNKVNTITAVYATGKYEAGTGTEIKIKSQPFVITCVESVDPSVEGAPVITISDKANAAEADFSKVISTIAKNQKKEKYIAVKYKVTGKDDTLYSNANNAEDKWTFETTNRDILIVDETSGLLLPVAEGTVSVIVKYDKAIVATFPITVGADAKSASIAIDKSELTMTNSDKINDTAIVKVTLKDQYGADFDNSDKVSNKISIVEEFTKKDKPAINVVLVDGNQSCKVEIKTANVPAGEYKYKLTRDNRHVTLRVIVKEAEKTTARVQVMPSTKEMDMKVTKASDVADKKVTIKLTTFDRYGTAAKTITGDAVSYVVKNTTTGKEWTINKDGATDLEAQKFFDKDADGHLVINTAINDNGTCVKMQAGTYVVTAKYDGKEVIDMKDAGSKNDQKNEIRIMQGSFVVKDTQDTTEVITKKVGIETTTNKMSDIATELKECFELANSLDNTRQFVVSDFDYTTSELTSSGQSCTVVVKKITTTETVGEGSDKIIINTVYDVNRSITVKLK